MSNCFSILFTGVYNHIIFIYDNWLEIFSFVVCDLFAFWLHKFDKNP